MTRGPTAPLAELPLLQLVIYALPSVTLQFLFVPMTALLPAFYARELSMSLATVGGVLLASRMADLVLDPLIGRLSDGTRTRWGRRKPWMVAGTPVLMLGAVLLFMPLSLGLAPAWYLLVASMVIYLGGSMLGLAYSAWGAEVVSSYHGRSKVAGMREALGVLGIVLAASVPAVTALYGHAVDRFTMGVLGWMILIITPVTVGLAIRFVPEPAILERAAINWRQQLLGLWRNKPFRVLCIAFVVMNLGSSVATSTLVFFIVHYLRQPEVIGPVLLGSFASVLAFVPVWVWISRRIGKHRAAGISLIAAILINAVVALLLQPGDGWWFVGAMIVAGAASAGYLTLPLGMMGDIIDFDALRTGQNRGGLYFGIWSFAQKISPAIAVGVTLPLLTYVGFDPASKDGTAGVTALKYIFALGSTPLFLIGALLLMAFPIDARRHAIIRRRLDSLAERNARDDGAEE
ncbi:MAG TPA: MFS transporter [Caulobacter sp.]|nr:MFS transporter [Caulobacter sp.]